MSTLAERLEKLPELLAERAARYRVPGATLAVLCEDEVFETATGVVNTTTGVEATPDAVFQIGSITKLFTTTLIMQLVDEGLVELDEPVRSYLPELELGDAEAAARITLRHLLTHTSGIDGDFFQDTGRGDDCVARYVLACSALGQLHAPGALFSYCNAGFALAGAIVERLRGRCWDYALRDFLLVPIGAKSMHTLPEWSVYYRSAVGHAWNPERTAFEPVPVPVLVRSNGPAGATPYAAARDLLELARLHLSGGLGVDGQRVLSEASVAAMQEEQARTPDDVASRGQGLGWMLFEWSGQRVIGHDGGTIGQSSFFRIVPERRVAVALLTNGGNSGALYRRIFDSVLGELAGVHLPSLPEPDESIRIDPARYVGTYERLMSRQVVEQREGKLMLTNIQKRGLGTALEEPVAVELHPVTEATFCFTPPIGRFKNYVTFHEFGSDGRAGYLYMGRAAPRVR